MLEGACHAGPQPRTQPRQHFASTHGGACLCLSTHTFLARSSIATVSDSVRSRQRRAVRHDCSASTLSCFSCSRAWSAASSWPSAVAAAACSCSSRCAAASAAAAERRHDVWALAVAVPESAVAASSRWREASAAVHFVNSS